MPKRILIVDDEADISELIAYNLGREGYDVAEARDGRAALDRVRDFKPDALILDVMMPELTGTEVAERLRKDPETRSVPIIMLTAKSDETDELSGLAAGADDYVTKPFSMQVLMARLDAVLRRAEDPSRSGPLEGEGIYLDPDTHEVSLDGVPLTLTITEFRLLRTLLRSRGRVLDRRELIADAMGAGVTVTERTIDVHITSIRKKLGDRSKVIQTVRGAGYRFAG